MAIPEWYTSAGFLAQSAHLAWGALFVFAPAAMGAPHWLGPVLLLIWSAPKEFVWDLIVEQDTVPKSALDFGMYWLGGGLAWLMLGR